MSARQRTPRRSELNVITALQSSCLRLTRSRVNYCVAAGALNRSYGQRAGHGEAIMFFRHFPIIDESQMNSSVKSLATRKLRKSLQSLYELPVKNATKLRGQEARAE